MNRLAVVALAVPALALTALGTTGASATGKVSNHKVAYLNSLNSSGVTGQARVHVHHGTQLNARIKVHGAASNLVHAQHIHYGAQARHECPTIRDDKDRNFRVNVAEGVPQYGPIAVSLTTRGDASPASGLAVDRMPTAGANGSYSYARNDIQIASTATQNARAVAEAIRRGEGVVVIHGVDYNNNGKYDFEGAGVSELTPGTPGAAGVFPAEATDPAACGVLRH